ncbi:MAG: MFS transporter [Dehalococcoidales bacterium]|nr:MFS transporter [Dehalococcoidales bacterium]
MPFIKLFQAKPTLSEQETAQGLRMMTLEGMVSMGFFSITTSGLLTAFALALGANNFQIGVLAAIPFITQLLQIPAILLVEKVRRRKVITLSTWLVAQLFWFPVALIPILIETPGGSAISLLLGLMAIRGVFAAVTNCSWNSWVRDLVPQQVLGRFFARRLALSVVVAAVFGVGAALFTDYWRGQVPEGSAIFGFTYALLFGAFFLGLASPVFMSFMPEPLMQRTMGKQPSLWEIFTMPLKDRNFRQLMKFLLFWSFALNMAVPFFAVYMLERLGLPLSIVIGLSVLSQFFNILFLRVWGPFADRFGSKVILSLCASLYLLVILGWTFTTMPEWYFLTAPLLIVLHIFAGIASAGVSLAVGTIGFKLAPQKQSASYLSGVSLATNLGAGIGPLLGGFLAHFFSVRQLSLDFTWADPDRIMNLGVVHVEGLDFLFLLTFIIGLITLNMLAAIREDGEVGREVVLEELRAQTRSALRSVNFVPEPNFVRVFPLSFLKQVPGMDVAIGVTAYQLADTAKTLMTAALRSGRTAVKVARELQNELTKLWESGVLEPPEHDTEVARQIARGALHAADETQAKIEKLAAPAIVGIARALDKTQVNPYDALRGAAYGIVEGASEIGADLARAATEAIAGARKTAQALHLQEELAIQQAAKGILEAAQTLGSKALSQVKEALSQVSGIDTDTLIKEGDEKTGDDKTG